MRSAYRVLAYVIVIGVFAQAATIAFASFTVFNEVEGGAVFEGDYNAGHVLHATVGLMVMPLVALALFIVSFFAKLPGGVKWAGFVLLAVVVQVLLAFVSFAAPIVGLLHGINALIIIGLGLAAAGVAKPQMAGAPVASRVR